MVTSHFTISDCVQVVYARVSATYLIISQHEQKIAHVLKLHRAVGVLQQRLFATASVTRLQETFSQNSSWRKKNPMYPLIIDARS